MSLGLVSCGYPEFEFVTGDASTDGTVEDAVSAGEVDVPDAGTDSDPVTEDVADTHDATVDATPDATIATTDAAEDTRDARAADTRVDAPSVTDTSMSDTSVSDTSTSDTSATDTSDTAPTYVFLLGFGSTWKYRDDNNVPGTTWNGSGTYDDSAWKSGPAPLGYGAVRTEATLLGYGPDAGAKYTTSWFRKSFNVTDETKYDQLRIRLERDDGAVIFLNGTELARSNMPAGTIAPTTYAAATVGDETLVYTMTASVAPLKSGTNIIAVEVHQANGTSSDIHFDLELTARLAP